MSFSKIFQILSSLVQPFYSSFWSASTIHGVSHRHSQSLKTEEEFLLNPYPFFQRFMVLASCHPLIVFNCENSFHPSGAIHESFQFDSPKAIISEDLFILNIRLSFSKSYRCSIQVFSNQFMISSFHLYLNSLKHLRLLANPSWCFFMFYSFFFNSYGGSFKSSLPWLSYQFIRSFQSHRWFHQYLLKFTPYLS